MTWYSAQEGVASLPVGDQECYRYLYLSRKTDAKLPLSAVLLREYIIDYFWEYVRLQQTVPIPWNDTGKAAGNEIVSGGFLFCITGLL